MDRRWPWDVNGMDRRWPWDGDGMAMRWRRNCNGCYWHIEIHSAILAGRGARNSVHSTRRDVAHNSARPACFFWFADLYVRMCYSAEMVRITATESSYNLFVSGLKAERHGEACPVCSSTLLHEHFFERWRKCVYVVPNSGMLDGVEARPISNGLVGSCLK